MSEHFVNCANQPYAFTDELITKVHKTELNLKVLFVCDSALCHYHVSHFKNDLHDNDTKCHVEKNILKKENKKTPTSFLPPS